MAGIPPFLQECTIQAPSSLSFFYSAVNRLQYPVQYDCLLPTENCQLTYCPPYFFNQYPAIISHYRTAFFPGIWHLRLCVYFCRPFRQKWAKKQIENDDVTQEGNSRCTA